MRYVFGFLCVCALGVMPLVGCSETTGDGGTGGVGGDGGSGGNGGDGGTEPMERAWGTPERIDSEGSVQQPGELAVSAGGAAISVWLDWDSLLWTQGYVPDEGWGTAQRMELGGGFPSSAPPPQVAIASDGTAMLVWLEQQPDAIWATRYTPDGGWEALARLDRGFEAYSVSGPDVAMDESGRAIATWRRSSDGESVFASRYKPESGWSEAQRIDEPSAGWGYETRVAMNAAGDAIAVWKGDDGNSRHVFANKYAPATGWGTSTPLDDASDTFIEAPLQVAIDSRGNGIVVWHQEYYGELPYPTSSRITANRYVSESGWQGAAPIEGDEQSSSYLPDVATSLDGTAIVVWMRSGVDGGVFAMHYVSGTGWAPEALIFEYPFTGTDIAPRVAANAAGQALAIWRAFDSEQTVWSSHFIPSAGWDAAVKVNVPLGSCSEPQVGIDGEGNGIAVWAQSTASDSVCYANHYAVDEAPRR